MFVISDFTGHKQVIHTGSLVTSFLDMNRWFDIEGVSALNMLLLQVQNIQIMFSFDEVLLRITAD